MMHDTPAVTVLQGSVGEAMMPAKRSHRRRFVRTLGPVKPERATQEVVAFKRAAESFVRKATASEKSANAAMMTLGNQNRKGALTRTYR
jgi:hypothetical protein